MKNFILWLYQHIKHKPVWFNSYKHLYHCRKCGWSKERHT